MGFDQNFIRIGPALIRRETQNAWLIIDQREHARVSAELFAAHVSASGFAPCVGLAILRHDDGWQEWDEIVPFDDQVGRPLDFREMPRSDQDAVWARSVESVADLGTMAQAIIASHFIALRGVSPKANEPQKTQTHRAGLVRHYQPMVEAWSAELNQHDFADALAALKWFDNLSLWLCCSSRTEAWSTLDHRGAPIELAPIGSPAECDKAEHQVLRVHPWPFAPQELTVETPARRLPAAVYASRESLFCGLLEGQQLSWRLTPR